MAFVHGKDTVLLGDSVALTGYLTQASVGHTAQAVDVTVFGNQDHVFLPGLEDGSLTIAGLFDATGSHAELNTALAAASGKVVTVGYGGTTIGLPATMLSAREASYNINSQVTDAVRLAATFKADGGVRAGFSLHALGAETAIMDGASVTHPTVSSLVGGVAHLHVTAFTGTDCILKIQDSANDIAWADIITFSTVTGVTQERATVAGTVRKYVHASITGGTFSSITFAVSFSRNLHS